jgi:hypothetical protein
MYVEPDAGGGVLNLRNLRRPDRRQTGECGRGPHPLSESRVFRPEPQVRRAPVDQRHGKPSKSARKSYYLVLSVSKGAHGRFQQPVDANC